MKSWARKPDACGRQEGDRQAHGEGLRLGAARQIAGEIREARAVLHHHRKDRARLDEELEDLGALAVEIEQRRREDQVAGRRDRQELGEPFHHSEQERHPQHRGSPP
jgi:hypothetical protein